MIVAPATAPAPAAAAARVNIQRYAGAITPRKHVRTHLRFSEQCCHANLPSMFSSSCNALHSASERLLLSTYEPFLASIACGTPEMFRGHLKMHVQEQVKTFM